MLELRFGNLIRLKVIILFNFINTSNRVIFGHDPFVLGRIFLCFVEIGQKENDYLCKKGKKRQLLKQCLTN